MTQGYKPYLYLLPGKGYFAGNGCIDDDDHVIALHMLSHSTEHPKDIPGTQITYIRPTPKKMTHNVSVRVDRVKSSAVLQAIDARQALDILQQRGRTLEEIAAHPENFHGIRILREKDIEHFKKERGRSAFPTPKAKPTKQAAASRKKP